MKRLIAAGALIAGLAIGGSMLSACLTGECVVYSSGTSGMPAQILYGGSCPQAYLISAQIPGSTVEQAPPGELPTGIYNHQKP